MTKTIKKFKLTKQHILFITIELVCILAILAIIDYSYLHDQFLHLPYIVKSFLRQVGPMIAVVLSYFLWDKEIKRPNKLFYALIISFIIQIVFWVISQVISNQAMQLPLDAYEDNIKSINRLSMVIGYLIGINGVIQIVFTWIILKKSASASKVIKAVLVCFIAYMLAQYLIYYAFMDIRSYFAPQHTDTIEAYHIAEKWDRVTRIMLIPFKILRYADILVTIPLIIHFQGEQSLWYQFKKGPLRKFLKILRPYNPNGVE